MHRYVAHAWDRRSTEQNLLADSLARQLETALPGLLCVLSVAGLRVYTSSTAGRCCRSYVLDRDGGVVLGRVFLRRAVGDDPCEALFDANESREIRNTGGRHLLERYWGRYVAFLRDGSGLRVQLVRDPTGAVPCLLSRYRGIHFACSHIEDCAALGLVSNSIDWHHVAAFLWSERLVTRDTGLCGVRQVLAGERVTLDADGVTGEICWNPKRVHDARVVDDRRRAGRELRDVIRHCVGAWASCYGSVLHSLSGGLDSAVVLACLSGAAGGPSVVCQNYYAPAGQGDERFFARRAANRAGVELIETPIEPTVNSLDGMFDVDRVAMPSMLCPRMENAVAREKLLLQRGVEAVFSGQGGDHFFQQGRTRLIAADYAWRRGLQPGLAGVVVDTARLTGKPVWSVIAGAFRHGLLRRSRDPYLERLNPPLLLGKAAYDAFDPGALRHPWAIDANGLPAGKLRQIVSIVDSQNFYLQDMCSDADIVHPLISQPVIELCLQIPSYVLAYGGRDRALVRDTFGDVLPPEIAARTTKGATTASANELLIGNLPAIRALLLDGLLVREAMLDRAKTEANLSESRLIRDAALLWPVLNAVRAESWLRSWRQDVARVRAPKVHQALESCNTT